MAPVGRGSCFWMFVWMLFIQSDSFFSAVSLRYYDLLRVKPSASAAEVKKAYYKERFFSQVILAQQTCRQPNHGRGASVAICCPYSAPTELQCHYIKATKLRRPEPVILTRTQGMQRPMQSFRGWPMHTRCTSTGPWVILQHTHTDVHCTRI